MSMPRGNQLQHRNIDGDGHQGQGSYTGVFEPVISPQLAKDLLTAGKTIDDLLMRGDFVDENQATTVALAVAKLFKEGLTEEPYNELPTLLYKIEADTAIKGRRVMMFLQGLTGILVPKFFGSSERTMMRRMRPEQTEEKHQEEGMR